MASLARRGMRAGRRGIQCHELGCKVGILPLCAASPVPAFSPPPTERPWAAD
jgi:hypothetical protein